MPTVNPGISAKNLKTNATSTAQSGQATLFVPFEYGTSIQLTASGCPSDNTYAWYNNQTGKQTETGNSITVQPSAQTQYSAKCVNQSGCEGPSSAIVQANPLATNIKAFISSGTNPVVVCSESQALQSLLTTTGCGGDVKWYMDDLDGNRLNDIQVTSLTDTKPKSTTSYYATCNFAGKELSVSNTVQVIVPEATVAFNASSKSVVCQGIPVTLVAKGCHETGTLSWFKKSGNTSVAVTDASSRVGDVSFVNVTPDQTSLYFAKCQIGSCTSESSTIEVQVTPKSQAKPRVRVGTVAADMSTEVTVCLDKSFELFVENPSVNDRGYVWQAPNGGKTFGDPTDKSKGLSVNLIMEAAYAGRWTLLVYDNCSNVPVQKTFELKSVKQIFMAAFSYQQDGNTIQIKNNAYLVTNNGPVTNGLKYKWNFGDGQIDSTNRDPQHTYTAARGYQVALTVINPEDRCDATLTQLISVGCVRPAAPTISKVGTGAVTSLTICNNEALSLQAAGCTNKALWFINNRAEKIYEGSTLAVTSQLFPTSGTYQLVAQCKEGTDSNPCLSELSKPLSLTITTPPTPIVKIKNNATGEFVSDNYNYTPGTALTITAQGCDGFGSIRWEVKKGSTTLTPPTGTAFLFPMVGLSPVQGESYTFAAYCQQSSVSTTCESNRSNQPTLTVGSCPALSVAASSPVTNGTVTVCGGTELKLTASGGNGFFEWKDSKQRVVGSGSVFIPSTSGKYKAYSCRDSSSALNVEIISVEASILNKDARALSDTTVKATSNLTLVGNDLVPPSGSLYTYGYTWEGPTAGSAPYLQLNNIRTNQAGTYKVTVSKSLNSVTCKSSATARVVVQAAECNLKTLEPVITCGTGGATLKVRFSGANPALQRQFSLNGTTYQTDSTFKNLADSTYTLYVRERMGDQSQVCQAATKTVSVFCDTTAACEIYIQSKDSNGKVTSLLSRNNNNELQSLTLSAKTFSEKSLGNNVSYLWKGPNNFTSKAPTILAVLPGKYSVIINRGNFSCESIIELTSRPCNNTIPLSSCGTNGNFTAVPDEPINRLENLTVGDIIQAGDFEIIISKLISGNSDGWFAKGIVETPYLNTKIEVELKNAVINTCYQLTLGNSSPTQPTIISTYDPSWGNLVDTDLIIGNFTTGIKELTELTSSIFGWSDKYRGALEDCDAAKEYLIKLKSIRDNILSNTAYTSQQITVSTAQLNQVIQNIEYLISINCSCSVSTPSGRIAVRNESIINTLSNATTDNTCSVRLASIKEGLNNALSELGGMRVSSSSFSSIDQAYNSAEFNDWIDKLKKLYKLYTKCQEATFRPKDGGIIPECFWNNNRNQTPYYTPNDFAFFSGIIDGAYLDVIGALGLPTTIDNLNEVIQAYALYNYFNCKDVASEVELSRLRNELRKRISDGGLYDWMVSGYLQSELEQKQSHKNKCENYSKIRRDSQQFINDLTIIIEDLNWDSVIDGFNSLDNSIRNYIDEKSGSSNQSRYEQGKLLYLVASILEPNGKTGIKNLITNTKNSIQALPKITTKIDSKSLITKLQQETKQKIVTLKNEWKNVPSKVKLYLSNPKQWITHTNITTIQQLIENIDLRGMKIGIEILDGQGNFVKTHYMIIDQTWILRKVPEGGIYYHPISGIGNDQVRLLSSGTAVGKHNHLKPYLKVEKYDAAQQKGNIAMDYLGNPVTQNSSERYFLTHFNVTSISYELP